MKIRPLQDGVLVKRVEAEQTTASGIIIPGSAQEKPKEGEIVAIGKGRLLENGNLTVFDVSVGDRVLFGSFAGTEVKVDNKAHLLLKESDLLGVIL